MSNGPGLERIACDPEVPCPLRETIGCFEDVHHRYHPAATYKALGAVATTFRELPENKDRRCRNIHNIEHEVTDPPDVPDETIMALAVVEAINKGIIHPSKTKMRRLQPAINRALASDAGS